MAPITCAKRSPPKGHSRHSQLQRQLVECCFSKLKQFRSVATRFEKKLEIIRPAPRLPPSSYGCDKCSQDLVQRMPGRRVWPKWSRPLRQGRLQKVADAKTNKVARLHASGHSAGHYHDPPNWVGLRNAHGCCGTDHGSNCRDQDHDLEPLCQNRTC
jgi:hypothetical protein